MKTYQAELAFVGLALLLAVFLSHGGALETVGALAVLFSFAHAQVAERMREKQAAKAKPDVACHRWSLRYFMAKELLWCSYFVAHKSWAALVGVGVFLAYPLWRKWWRARRPIVARKPADVVWVCLEAFLNGRRFQLSAGSSAREVGDDWWADLVLPLEREGCEFVANLSRQRVETTVVVRIGEERFKGGTGSPVRLVFSDRHGQRFARLQLRGEGGLSDV